MGCMRVMGYRSGGRMIAKYGDQAIKWTTTETEQMQEAERIFNELMSQGSAAFVVSKQNPQNDRRITTFEPEAETILVIPPMAGG